jgi:CO/xanthine dehydrogenase Mo-binding subunit
MSALQHRCAAPGRSGLFALESAMDELALKLKVDPVPLANLAVLGHA